MTEQKPKYTRSTVGKTQGAPLVKAEALFRSVRAALAFAYSIQYFPIASSPKLGLPTGGSGRLANLSPQEKHAQGALIRLAAEQRMQGIDIAVTFAFFGSGEIREQAIREVGNRVALMVRKPGLGVELAKRQFSRNGIRKSQQFLATEFDLSKRRMETLDKMVGDEIERLRLEVENKLLSMFVRTGISEGI